MRLDDQAVQRLRSAAVAAAGRAYSPYSRFPVGAAVLTESGEVFAAANVENASFGLTVCAERNAAFQAVSSGHRRIVAVAVYTPTERPTAPCGACRQVIAEFGPTAEVLCFADGPAVLRRRLDELLPEAFGPGALG